MERVPTAKRRPIVLSVLAPALALLCLPAPMSQKGAFSPYEVKAAWLVNFLKFVEVPEEALAGKNIITIGVVGRQPSLNLFKGTMDRQVKGRKLSVRIIPKYKESDDIEDCQILFISAGQKRSIPQILDEVDGRMVLTVSEVDGFLEVGGMVNFIYVNGGIRFEINQRAAKDVGLRLPSSLLGKAHKVIRR